MLLLAFLAGAGGLARTAAIAPRNGHGERLAIAAGLGAAADMIGHHRREAKRLDGALSQIRCHVKAEGTDCSPTYSGRRGRGALHAWRGSREAPA